MMVIAATLTAFELVQCEMKSFTPKLVIEIVKWFIQLKGLET